MEGIDALINVGIGYISVPLAALATSKKWPSKVRFAVAVGLALGIAYLTVWLRGDPLTTQNLLSAFGIAFVAQQATFHLELPGAGSPVVVDKAQNLPGSGA